MDDHIPPAAASGPETTPDTAIGEPAPGTRIDIVSDAICPWCYIGKRKLERALEQLANAGLRFSVHWNPYQLNPDMPKEGRDRTAYRVWKFGSPEKARELDTNVTQAAAEAGLTFHLDHIARTPNTLDAHRLIWSAGRKAVQDAAMEAVFAAYFIQGRDIGDPEVLADCAAQAGLDVQETAQFLSSDTASREMLAADRAAREAGVSGVPSFFLDGYGLWSGALPADTMAQALQKGHEILQQRAHEAPQAS